MGEVLCTEIRSPGSIGDVYETLKIEQNKKIYFLNIKIEDNTLTFLISEEGALSTIQTKYYIKKMTLQEIREMNNAFYGINSCNEFLDYIKISVENKKLFIKENDENMSINIEVSYLFKTCNVEIILSLENVGSGKVIKEIINELDLIKEQIKNLENNSNNEKLEINNKKEEINKLNEEIKNLNNIKDENKKLLDEIKKLNEDVKSIKDLDEKNKKVEEEINILKQEIKELKDLHNNSENKKLNDKEEKNKKEEEMNLIKQEIKEIKDSENKKINDEEEKNKKTQEEINLLKQEIKELKDLHNNTENKKINDEEEKNKKTEEEINLIKQEIKELKDSENKKLNDEEKNKIIKELLEKSKGVENQKLIEENNNIKLKLDEISKSLQHIRAITSVIYNKPVLMNNDKEFDLIITEIEKQVNKKVKGLEKIYQATIDGGDPSIFHSKCDNIPYTLTIICSEKKRRFGGFTTAVWDTSGSYKDDKKSFLFSLDKKKIYSFKSNGQAIYCHKDFGPTFGSGYTIKIGGNAIKEKKLYTYEFYPDGCSYNFNGDTTALSESGKGNSSCIYSTEYEVFKVLFYDLSQDN